MDFEWDNWAFWGVTLFMWAFILLAVWKFPTGNMQLWVKLVISVAALPITWFIVNWRLGE